MGLPLFISDLTVPGDNGRVLLSIPELAVPSGALVGIEGPSGAGKSTLLYTLAGLQDAKGSIRWGDDDVLQMSPGKRTRFRAEQIGMIFQDFLLFEELDAETNATLAALFQPRRKRGTLRARAAAWLDVLGLADQRRDRTVASFSGGERQRVAVARALAPKAPVLLADEPTASLDRAAADRLIDDLTFLARRDGTTLMTVSHDPALLARMDRVLRISDGALVADRDEYTR